MSFEKKQWRANSDLSEKEMNDLEGRIDDGIGGVEGLLLKAFKEGWNIEWEKRTLNFSSSGYASISTKKHMTEPHNAVVLIGVASYGRRKSTISAWTISNNPTLIEVFLHDETGKVVTGEVQIQYVVIYK